MFELQEICVDVLYSAGGKAGNGSASECSHLRFQSSLVDVYARFVVVDEDEAAVSSFLLHRKAQFLVTDVVRPLLQVADETVAHLRDGRFIDGLKPGLTSLQVTRLHTPTPTFIITEDLRIFTVY